MDDLLRNQFAKESLHNLIKRTKHDMMERGPFHHIILGAVDHTQNDMMERGPIPSCHSF